MASLRIGLNLAATDSTIVCLSSLGMMFSIVVLGAMAAILPRKNGNALARYSRYDAILPGKDGSTLACDVVRYTRYDTNHQVWMVIHLLGRYPGYGTISTDK